MANKLFFDFKKKIKAKKYVVVTRWGYPFGGGEAYMRETLIWCRSQNMQCFWLSFTNEHNKPQQVLSVKETEDGYLSIVPPGGFSENTLGLWLDVLKPDIVHHQGHNRK